MVGKYEVNAFAGRSLRHVATDAARLGNTLDVGRVVTFSSWPPAVVGRMTAGTFVVKVLRCKVRDWPVWVVAMGAR